MASLPARQAPVSASNGLWSQWRVASASWLRSHIADARKRHFLLASNFVDMDGLGWSSPLHRPNIYPPIYFVRLSEIRHHLQQRSATYRDLKRETHRDTTNTDTSVLKLTAQDFLVCCWSVKVVLMHAMKTWSGGMAPLILDLGSVWTCVVSFTERPVYSQKEPPVTDLVGGWVGCRTNPDGIWTLPVIKPRILACPATNVLTSVWCTCWARSETTADVLNTQFVSQLLSFV